MDNIKLSVIIPVYNAELYIDKCLGSVLNQTYKNLEIIAVDDGSSDNCPVILDKYAETDKRVKVVHVKNAGVSEARNHGLDLSTGDYVYFLDSDDWIELEAFEKLVGLLKDGEVDCLGFNFVKEFGEKSEYEKNVFLQEKLYVGEQYNEIISLSLGLVGDKLKYFQKTNAFSVIWSKIYKKSIIDSSNIRFKDIRELGSFEDGLFNLKFFLNAKSFYYTEKPLYHYRKDNQASVTANYKENFYFKQLKQIEYLSEILGDYSIFYKEETNNRVSYMALEYCLNALKSKKSKKEQKQELKLIFKNKKYTTAVKNFKTARLPFKWKIYYFFLKIKWFYGVFFMTGRILSSINSKHKKKIEND